MEAFLVVDVAMEFVVCPSQSVVVLAHIFKWNGNKQYIPFETKQFLHRYSPVMSQDELFWKQLCPQDRAQESQGYALLAVMVSCQMLALLLHSS